MSSHLNEKALKKLDELRSGKIDVYFCEQQNGSWVGMDIEEEGMKEIVQEMIRTNTLEEIYLSYNKLGPKGATVIADALKTYKKINELRIGSNKILDEGAKAFARMFPSNNTLKVLTMNDNGITDDGAIAIAKSLSGNACLEMLSFYANKGITDASAPAFHEMLKKTAITKFNIDETGISSAERMKIERLVAISPNKREQEGDFKYVPGILSEKAQLKLDELKSGKIDVYFCEQKDGAWIGMGIDESGMRIIVEEMKKTNTLEEIYLSFNILGPKGAKVIADAMMDYKKINELRIGSNKILDEGAKAFARMFSVNNTLKVFTLNDNGITDEGAIALARSIMGNTCLDMISFYGNKQITDASVPALVEMINASHVNDVRVGETGISTAGQTKIQQAQQTEKSMRVIKKFIDASLEQKMILEEKLREGAAVPLNRSKIMMTGPGRAGKSATVRSLLGKPFNPNLESTVGADASQTCSVDRNENVVNWSDKPKTSEFKAHTARAIAAELREKERRQKEAASQEFASSSSKDKKQESASSNGEEKPRRQSLLRRASDAISRRLSLTKKATSNNDEKPSDADAKFEEPVQIPNSTFSLKDDQEALGMYDEEMVSKALKEQGRNTNVAMSIWDLGGQEVFYTLHHLFLTKFAVYLCIFDMRHMISDDKTVQAKSLDYTNFWLRSIQMHAPGAPVYLLGTFKDTVPTDAQHDKINETLCIKLKLNSVAPTLVKNSKRNIVFWPIDNSKGAQGDPVIQELRESIMDTACTMKHIEMQVPLAWTRVYDKLMETKKRTLTLREVLEISRRYSIDERQVIEMLALFHQLGMILHFNKTEELRDLVILEPQWLVDALTMVIRDFELHEYEKNLKNDILITLAEDLVALKSDSIASVNLLYRLWKGEDGNSDIEFTRRKFLVSIMEQMTLSCPWQYDEDEQNEEKQNEERDIFHSRPPATKFLIPSNLRLFRPPEIESKIKSQMNKKIPTINLQDDGSITVTGKNKTPDSFIIDFSASFLPIGFFDRLTCLLVAFSSLCFKDSRTPLVGSCSVLMSFGTNDFRVDEQIDRNRIIVTMAKEVDCKLVLQHVESMINKLRDEVMGSQLKYRILFVIWRDEEETALVDIEKAREAVEKKLPKIRDSSNELVKTSEFADKWVNSSISIEISESVRQVTQTLPHGKKFHVYILHSSNAVDDLVKDLSTYSVKAEYDMSSLDAVKHGIDVSMCVVLLATKTIFNDGLVEKAFSYISESKKRTPVILVQEGAEGISSVSEETTLIKLTAPPSVLPLLRNLGTPIIRKHRYSHERTLFVQELCTAIQQKCLKEATLSSNYVAFLSHVKAEAGGTARILHDQGEAFLKTGSRIKDPCLFLDSDHLSDLRLLLDDVKKSSCLIAMLSKSYLTRPWCLAELHAAISNNIPIVSVYVVSGGYNYEEASTYLSKLNAQSLDESNPGASKTLEEIGIDVSKLGKDLFAVFPKIIASKFDPNEGSLILKAQTQTIMEKVIDHIGI